MANLAYSDRAAKAGPTAAETDSYLRLGLRNRWHPVLPSRFVAEKPVGIRRMGERIVLWRDAAGAIHAMTDRCPHRGAPLSVGHVRGDRIACWYHAVEIGADGTVLCVPGEPGCSLEGKRLVKAFPAREVKGAIFLWMGDALHPDPAPYTPPPQLQEDAFDAFLSYQEWRTPWRFLYDNNMDPMHGQFLHAQSHSMAKGERKAEFAIRKTETGFVFEKTTQKDVNFDWSEWCDAGAIYCRLEIPYPASGGPGGNFGIIFHATPIDARTTACFFWRFRKVSGWQRDAWRFLYKARLEARHYAVLEQDRAIAEGMDEDADRDEHLYSHDGGVVRMRNVMRAEARAQLKALRAAGIDPLAKSET
jgi:phenylpropionate dioxygenase-like ring-hydroxylating dioxygenase large terminal subunit